MKNILTVGSALKISMFSKVAENMMADYIQSIQIAQDGVVTEIYPEDGNEAGIAMKSYIDYGAAIY